MMIFKVPPNPKRSGSATASQAALHLTPSFSYFDGTKRFDVIRVPVLDRCTGTGDIPTVLLPGELITEEIGSKHE